MIVHRLHLLYTVVWVWPLMYLLAKLPRIINAALCVRSAVCTVQHAADVDRIDIQAGKMRTRHVHD